MTEKITTKVFDCIAYKRHVQSELYEETKDMTAPELITYFRERARSGPYAELRAKLQAQRTARRSGTTADVE